MNKIKHLEYKFSIASNELISACEDDELRFYLWLKLWAIKKHNAFPSMITICSALNKSKPTIIALIKRMEDKNRLKVSRMHRKNNIYDITWYDEMANSWVKNLYLLGKKPLPNRVKKFYPNEYSETRKKERICNSSSLEGLKIPHMTPQDISKRWGGSK